MAEEAPKEEAPPAEAPQEEKAPAEEAPKEDTAPPPPAEEAPKEQTSAAAAAESEESEEAVTTAIVAFVILPEHYGQTKEIDVSTSVLQIRESLEAELTIPSNSLSLMNLTGDGVPPFEGSLPHDRTLASMGVKPGMKIGIELRISYFEEKSGKEYKMPDVLDITIIGPDGTGESVKVSVDKFTGTKPYAGGYRNKQSGVVFHHAATQTPKERDPNAVQKVLYHRDAQTVEQKTRSVQSKREAGTQMPKNGLYVSETGDTVIEACMPYFSSADLTALRLEKAVIIQCHCRGMFARKRARQLRDHQDERVAFLKQEKDREKLEADLRHKREIERRMHPRTFEDFEILYQELEMWRVKETKRIKENAEADDATKQAALQQLLDKETKLLQTIDKLKIEAHKANRASKIRKNLEAMAQPKVWAQSDNETTTVHTPFTTRAKELLDLYNGLNMPLLSIDERLDVLLHVKWTVKEFDCNLTRDIVDLIDREADMLNRGRSEGSLKNARKRLANLFLQFVETPEFNPEALKFQRVPRDMVKQTPVAPLSTLPIKG